MAFLCDTCDDCDGRRYDFPDVRTFPCPTCGGTARVSMIKEQKYEPEYYCVLHGEVAKVNVAIRGGKDFCPICGARLL